MVGIMEPDGIRKGAKRKVRTIMATTTAKIRASIHSRVEFVGYPSIHTEISTRMFEDQIFPFQNFHIVGQLVQVEEELFDGGKILLFEGSQSIEAFFAKSLFFKFLK